MPNTTPVTQLIFPAIRVPKYDPTVPASLLNAVLVSNGNKLVDVRYLPNQSGPQFYPQRLVQTGDEQVNDTPANVLALIQSTTAPLTVPANLQPQYSALKTAAGSS